MYEDKLSSPLGEKLRAIYKNTISYNFCSWSDLLGFGSTFTKSNWKISDEEWLKIGLRLDNFYKIYTRNHSSTDYMFMLNDAIIKVHLINSSKDSFSDIENFQILEKISYWFINIVLSHIETNNEEISNGLPGVRTIISFGEKIEYTFPDIKLDDFTLNYARKNFNDISNVAKYYGNPIIISNPLPLQMNTAFSKSYILDEIGGSQGLKGNGLYIDESVFEALLDLIQKTNILAKEERIINTEKLVTFKCIENNSDTWSFAFLLGPKIQVDNKKLKTNVFKLIKYFPPDEDDGFYFEL